MEVYFSGQSCIQRQAPHTGILFDRPENAPVLISIIGQDSAGALLLQHWQSLQLPCNGILRKGGVSTPMTSYIFNQGKPHAH